jgi:cytochrome c biogenesis protein CcmG/thiol:disulfide interchange protein DsbE
MCSRRCWRVASRTAPGATRLLRTHGAPVTDSTQIPPPDQQPSGAGHPSLLRSADRRRRIRWGAIGGIAGCVVVVAAISAFGLTRNPSAVRPVLLGKPAPDFTARTLDGSSSVRLSRLRGQVVVLNFWASWCPECVVEHPALANAWERYRDHGVVVLGMSFNDATGSAASFASRLSMEYPVLVDPGDRTALAYGVTGPPETFLIDASGMIAGKWVGPVRYQELSDQIRSLLVGGAGASG